MLTLCKNRLLPTVVILQWGDRSPRPSSVACTSFWKHLLWEERHFESNFKVHLDLFDVNVLLKICWPRASQSGRTQSPNKYFPLLCNGIPIIVARWPMSMTLVVMVWQIFFAALDRSRHPHQCAGAQWHGNCKVSQTCPTANNTTNSHEQARLKGCRLSSLSSLAWWLPRALSWAVIVRLSLPPRSHCHARHQHLGHVSVFSTLPPGVARTLARTIHSFHCYLIEKALPADFARLASKIGHTW